MKVITVIGARPQIIKASAISRAIHNNFSNQINEILVHTGQHYDENMSEVFFSQLNIPKPKYNLGVHAATHGKQTAMMIEGLEEIFVKERPDAVIVYGDTNSTLAGAIAAGKMQIPIVHIEAGLRSFDKTMPEEINRILCDHVSTLLFCPTKTGFDNLIKEGFSATTSLHPTFNTPNIYHCGDIMYDNTLYFRDIALCKNELKEKYGKDFVLCTVHRNTNTDNKEKLSAIFTSLLQIAQYKRIILPLHPRTKKMMSQLLSKEMSEAVFSNANLHITEPVSFLDMIYLENNSCLVITDSGGVQKEAYYLQKPCVILRPQTEWTEILDTQSAVITDTNERKIVDNALDYLANPPENFPNIFGDGKASEFICQTMIKTLE